LNAIAASSNWNRAVRTKAAFLDRVTEALYHKQVNGKPLKDCYRADFLRQAAENDARGEELRVESEMYRAIAKMLPDGKTTVQEARSRGEIIALLTTTYKENA